VPFPDDAIRAAQCELALSRLIDVETATITDGTLQGT